MRTMLLGLLTALWIVAVCGRLVYLTVIARDSLRERGELQHQHTLKLDPNRGTIRDRNGRELARSVEVESIYAVPTAYSGEGLGNAARRLASCLELSEKGIAARLEGGQTLRLARAQGETGRGRLCSRTPARGGRLRSREPAVLSEAFPSPLRFSATSAWTTRA